MWGLLRTRRWISFTVTAVLAIAAFGALSHWQWLRAQEEDAKAQVVATGAAADAVPISAVLAPGSELPPASQWRSVTARGELDCSVGYLVRNRPLNTTNGLWAVCGLRTDEGAWLWVNRGWMAAPGPATAAVPMPPGPASPVEVTGRLRPSESGPPRPPADLPAGQVSHLDTDVLAAQAGLSGPLYEPYLEATAMVPADPGGLAPLPLPAADSLQNYSYAGQWLLFAAVAVGGWFFFLRREAVEEGQRVAVLS